MHYIACESFDADVFLFWLGAAKGIPSRLSTFAFANWMTRPTRTFSRIEEQTSARHTGHARPERSVGRSTPEFRISK